MSHISDLEIPEKTNWFTGKLVGTSDIERDRNYFENILSVISKGGLGNGILYGLDISANPFRDGVGHPWKVNITGGAGVFPNGTLGIIEHQTTPIEISNDIQEPKGFFDNVLNAGKRLGVYLVLDPENKITGAVPVISASGSCQDSCETLLFRLKPKLVFDFLPGEDTSIPAPNDLPQDTLAENISNDGKKFVNSYYQNYLSQNYVGADRQNRILLTVVKQILGNQLEIDIPVTKEKRRIVFNNELLYHMINAHISQTGNTHNILPKHVGEDGTLVSINDVKGWEEESHKGNVLISSDVMTMRSHLDGLSENQIDVEPLFKIKSGVLKFSPLTDIPINGKRLFGPIPLKFSDKSGVIPPDTIPLIMVGRYDETRQHITHLQYNNPSEYDPDSIISAINIKSNQFLIEVKAKNRDILDTENFTVYYHALFPLQGENHVDIGEFDSIPIILDQINIPLDTILDSIRLEINDSTAGGAPKDLEIILPKSYYNAAGSTPNPITNQKASEETAGSKKFVYNTEVELITAGADPIDPATTTPIEGKIYAKPGEVGTIIAPHDGAGTPNHVSTQFKKDPQISITGGPGDLEVRQPSDIIEFEIEDADRTNPDYVVGIPGSPGTIDPAVTYNSEISLTITHGTSDVTGSVLIFTNTPGEEVTTKQIHVQNILNATSWTGFIKGREVEITDVSYGYHFPENHPTEHNRYLPQIRNISNSNTRNVKLAIPDFYIPIVRSNENDDDSILSPIMARVEYIFPRLIDPLVEAGDNIQVQAVISNRTPTIPGTPVHFTDVKTVNLTVGPAGPGHIKGQRLDVTIADPATGTAIQTLYDLLKAALERDPVSTDTMWISLRYKGKSGETLNIDSPHYFVDPSEIP